MYGYLQKGEFQKAKDLVYEMKDFCTRDSSARAKAHFIAMQAAYLTESGDWDDPIAESIMDLGKVSLWAKSVQHFTQAISPSS